MEPKVSIQEGWKVLEDLTINADQFQQKVLEEILKQNAGTEYLKRFLDGQADKELFKKKVPITTYDGIKPYIERIVVNGEPADILLAEPVTAITLSSGTSRGQAKMMPLTNKQLDQLTYCRSLAMSAANKFVDGLLEEGKQMQLLFVRPDIYVPSGLPARPILTSYHKSKNFEKYESSLYTSPMSTILCLDSKQSLYCQFLCGLLQRDEVVNIGAVFASVLFRAIRFLEDYWRELCSNIRTGRLSDWITDTGCKNALSLMLTGPNPEQADLIEAACNSKSWEGIIKKLWPKAKYIDVIATGSMAQYLPILEFYCGGIPVVSMPYASSESFLGINLKPFSKPCDVSYTLVPDVAYFEFLPVKDYNEEETKEVQSDVKSDNDLTEKQTKKEEIEPVELVNVALGQCYELVITTCTGLYRYKVGDVLMVTGFHNNAPQFQFVRRQDVVLSVDVEKTSEDELLEAMTKAKLLLEPFGLVLTDYSSYADVSTVPGHYVLFWELNMDASSDLPEFNPKIIEQCCSTVEESLNYLYKNCRKGNTVGPLEIRMVEQGTFDALMDFYISKGSSVSQYKTPRCIKLEEAFKVLDSRVVKRYFSQKVPA
ncbi:GH3 family - like 7 [Theobroma cacao]|uniref:Indole-3-acetic acid-amido synthetase GH3.17 n=1 Tax=Theobroma cacao TaxID=3641 RepID=A0A061E5F4_THECC|nr:Indole-3-acetic acid-amido synthetase GH3.17 [Theobroma cacao]WRX15578.1 GH3 family - like 7 [Theobroma cacao]